MPLLLVHGNLSYYRLARLIKYSFYKNITFAFVLFYYQVGGCCGPWRVRRGVVAGADGGRAGAETHLSQRCSHQLHFRCALW